MAALEWSSRVIGTEATYHIHHEGFSTLKQVSVFILFLYAILGWGFRLQFSSCLDVRGIQEGNLLLALGFNVPNCIKFATVTVLWCLHFMNFDLACM